ncbi:hypothetical protein FQN50_004546 [Emmonsiellopsis sp. PD_5]|nr:hypothetical protein FQN50_004546 [Emmonsiellopsis sp. PD_5]
MSYSGYEGLPQCGCWYHKPQYPLGPDRIFLPQVNLEAHSTILASTSKTTLTQTFINPESKVVKNLKYTFPLYDGVSVVGFKCTIADRVIHGLVKEREEAKSEYQEAVRQGQSAALLEQSTLASDTFTTSIGNIPAGSTAVVEITYLGELQHDAQADGVRFCIPSAICPRYASAGVNVAALKETLADVVRKGSIRITVDVSVDKGSSIRGLQSPSHPIAISLGRTSVAAEDVFEQHLASATLTMKEGDIFFDKDFVLIVNAKDQEIPAAFLESHPTIPNQRALMATLVPKFNLPNNSPEIVFVIDRSGSMGGKIKTLQDALRVFLKSLPVGIKFNICSFGSSHSFMWKKSQKYDATSLEKALAYVDTVDADFGGTEMYAPVEATVKNRLKDLDLEVLLLTDGEIWDQESLFTYINAAVSDKPIRFFSLGIGDGASHSLIQGIARAGNGFAQSVNDNEQLDKKVVRMLKGALTPHIKDYTVEIVYEGDGDEDFEIIDKANEIPTAENFPPPHKQSEDAMDVDSKKEDPKPKQTISLFDPSYQESDIRSEAVPEIDLPKLQAPNVLQAPYKMPPLYPFNRTTVYLLLSPETVHQKPKSLLLKGTSKHGPLALKIPIDDVGQGTTIHQLAARKITLELEEGRGWVYHAKDTDGKLILDNYESKKEDIVKHEAVRLGVQFQVAGKYCSFVAVDPGSKTNEAGKENSVSSASEAVTYNPEPQSPVPVQHYGAVPHMQMMCQVVQPSAGTARYRAPVARFCDTRGGSPPSVAYECSTRGGPPTGGDMRFSDSEYSSVSLFGSSVTNTPLLSGQSRTRGPGREQAQASLFGGAAPSSQIYSKPLFSPPAAPPHVPPPVPGSSHSAAPFGSGPASQAQSGPLFGAPRASYMHSFPSAFSSFGTVTPTTSPSYGSPPINAHSSPSTRATGIFSMDSHAKSDDIDTPIGSGITNARIGGGRTGGLGAGKQLFNKRASGRERGGFIPAAPPQEPELPKNKVRALISLQSFEGSWEWNDALFGIMELSAFGVERKLDWASVLGMGTRLNSKDTKQRTIVATLLVVAYLHKKWAAEKETWELVAEKGMGWAVEEIRKIGGSAAGKKGEELLGAFDAVF